VSQLSNMQTARVVAKYRCSTSVKVMRGVAACDVVHHLSHCSLTLQAQSPTPQGLSRCAQNSVKAYIVSMIIQLQLKAAQ
jgi:hypothetical protein